MKGTKVIVIFTVIISILFFTLNGHALSVRQNISVITWSDDGESVILSIDSNGPEGGGSFGFRIISGKYKINQYFEVSNDMSSGGGSRFQRLSLFDCNKSLDKLKKYFGKLKFADLDLIPFGCWNSKRTANSLLKFKKEKGKKISLSHIAAYSMPRNFNGFLFENKKGELTIHYNSKVLYQRKYALSKKAMICPVFSPNKKMLIVIIRYYSDFVSAVFYKKRRTSNKYILVKF